MAQTATKLEDEVPSIDETLQAAFGQGDPAEVRRRVIDKDGRSEAAFAATYADLDHVLELLLARLVPEPSIPPLPPELPTTVADPGLEMAPPELPPEAVLVEAPPIPAEALLPPAPPPPEDLPLIPPITEATDQVNLLYEDIVWLVSIDDWGGALISLERLLVMADLSGHIKEFIDVNEVKLLNLYDSYLGPFTKVPKLTDATVDNAMPGAYRRTEKLSEVFELVDGAMSIKELFNASDRSPLETCSAINQLRRAGLLEV